MLYVASLNAPAKKAYPNICYSTTVQKIVDNIHLDPAVSGMNACVLGPKDLVGMQGQKLRAAMKTKHEDICVIFLYQKDKEADLLEIPTRKQVKKITVDSVKEAIDTFTNTQLVSGEKTVVSRDSQAQKSISSKPVDKTFDTAGAKGRLGRSSFMQGKKKQDSSGEKEIQYDTSTELYYFLDALGHMVYCDPETKIPLSPADVQAQKDALKRTHGDVTGAFFQEETADNADADEDDIPLNIPAKEETAATVESEPVQKQEVETVPKVEQPIPEKFTYTSLRTREPSDFEKNLESIKDFHDWNLFKDALKKDNAVRALLEENSSFQGCVQMMSVLDEEIKAVYYDAGLRAEQKFEQILEIGGKRSTLMATHNDLLAKKVLGIMEAITISAKRTVEDVLLDHRRAMEQITVSDKNIGDETKLMELIHKRANAEIELLALIKNLISLYQAMDIEVSDVLMSIDKNLPSDNEFINNMVGSAGEVLTPTNTKEIATTMMKALQSHREQFALLQDSVEQIIDAIHGLLKKDSEIIEHQQYMIKMLKAHRVEDSVVLDTVLKSILHVYVGTPNTGRCATALTLSGVQSRKRNTLLIDLTGTGKLHRYGETPMDLDEFLKTRVERPLMVVEGQVPDVEYLMEMIRELKTRLDYYAYINILCDAGDVENLKLLAEEALTINFITNCTVESMYDTAEVYAKVRNTNVARKLILIDPQVDILKLAKRMRVDPTTTKCVTIPNLPKVKASSVLADGPYIHPEVRMAFEEAFR